MRETVTWNIHIKNIFDCKWFLFVKINHWKIRDVVHETVRRILSCWRNLWLKSYICPKCKKKFTVFFTCKSRFCNSCSKPASDKRFNKLLSRIPRWIGYHHVVLTIPEELRIFFKNHRDALRILPRTAADSFLIFCNKKYKGIPGIIAVIHTFWAALNRNPHVHLLITHWVVRDDFFFDDRFFIPYQAIRTPRTKRLIKNLKVWCYDNLHWDELIKEIHFLNDFYDYKNKNGEKTSRYGFFSEYRIWVSIILSYIWRYLKRPVIAESRILDFDGENVRYVYKDKKDNNLPKEILCSAIDFIWRLVQHIPNKWFPMIFYYWAFSNRIKSKTLKIINRSRPSNRFCPRSPCYYASRFKLFTDINPFICECWCCMELFMIEIPWYKTKYFSVTFSNS